MIRQEDEWVYIVSGFSFDRTTLLVSCMVGGWLLPVVVEGKKSISRLWRLEEGRLLGTWSQWSKKLKFQHNTNKYNFYLGFECVW